MAQVRLSSRNSWLCISAAITFVILTIASACSMKTGMSEIDSYQLAVKTQTKADALRFTEAFGTSHLVGDLIESLPPDVALQVCADLSGSAAGNAERSCEPLREIAAIAPASSIPPPTTAPVSPQVSPTTAEPRLVPPFRPNQTAATPPEATQATAASPRSETASQVASAQTVAIPATDDPKPEATPTKVGSTIETTEAPESTTMTPEPRVSPEAENARGAVGKSMVHDAKADGGSAEGWLLRTSAKDGSSATATDSAQAAARAAAKAKAAAEAKAKAEAEAKAKAKDKAAKAKAAKAAMERRKKEKDGSSSSGSKKGSGRDSKN